MVIKPDTNSYILYPNCFTTHNMLTPHFKQGQYPCLGQFFPQPYHAVHHLSMAIAELNSKTELSGRENFQFNTPRMTDLNREMNSHSLGKQILDDKFPMKIMEDRGNDPKELDELLIKMTGLSMAIEKYKVTLKEMSQPTAIAIQAEMPKELHNMIQECVQLAKEPSDGKKTRGSKKNSKVNNQKNFPKKIGDKFCDYINTKLGIKTNQVLKDKMSWKTLNKYLCGDSQISRTVDHKAFTKCFAEFMMNHGSEGDQISRSTKTISTLCYTVNAVTLGLCCREILQRIQNGEEYGYIRISKSWPKAEVELYQ